MPPREPSPKAATGISGFDDILGGGFPRNHIYMRQLIDGLLRSARLREGDRQGVPGCHRQADDDEMAQRPSAPGTRGLHGSRISVGLARAEHRVLIDDGREVKGPASAGTPMAGAGVLGERVATSDASDELRFVEHVVKTPGSEQVVLPRIVVRVWSGIPFARRSRSDGAGAPCCRRRCSAKCHGTITPTGTPDQHRP